MPTMRKMQREKTFDVRMSLRGIAYVVICIMAFIFLMGLVVVTVRFIVG